MRWLKIGFAGGSVAATVFFLSGLTSGLGHSVLLMTAMLCTALTVGFAGAALVDALDTGPTRTNEPGVPVGRKVKPLRAIQSRGRCGVCLRMRQRLGAIWVCLHCDTPTYQEA